MDAIRWRDEQRRLRAAVHERRTRTSAPSPGPSPPFVSVIVVAWNAADVLGRCLDCLFAQDYADREIVVVDDGSDDGTVEVAERASARSPLTLVRGGRNRGCPAARNLGVRHAGGEIVAFVDADGFAAPDWLTRVVARFGDDQTIGGVASTVFYDDNPIVINGAGGTVNRQGWAADLSMNESFEFAEIADEALYPMGCGMAVRRAALERVGPFDDAMLNYYDDVDYGIRLWRAGYRVAVARDAWVDHAATGSDSPRKRLWCERHRMRVVLKHAAHGVLGRWAAGELRELRLAAPAVRAQKLRAFAWNVGRLRSALAERRRLRRERALPDALVADVWGNGFPAGVPLRLRPEPELASDTVDMADPAVEKLLPYGWFPSERADGRSFRWAGASAAALVSLASPARRLHLDFVHVPVDIGGVDVRIRRVVDGDRPGAAWHTRLSWQYVSHSVENHPLTLPPGDYEVIFDARRGWTDPPSETRSLALALAGLSLNESFEIREDGLEMIAPAVEEQLVRGWYEPEVEGERHYRWATRRAEAVVRVAAPARRIGLVYRMPPGDTGALSVTVESLDRATIRWSGELPSQATWAERLVELDLAVGEHLLTFEVERTWSNPEGADPKAPPENRALGFALASVTFTPRAP